MIKCVHEWGGNVKFFDWWDDISPREIVIKICKISRKALQKKKKKK